MSTSYHAYAFYGYSLPRAELTRSIPNPLWGKHKYDPDSGEKVTQFIDQHVDLGLESGDNHPRMKKFTRFDAGYDDRDAIILGVELAEMDLSYGSPEPQEIKLLLDEERCKIAAMARELLEKAGVQFDPEQMGYWLGGYAG